MVVELRRKIVRLRLSYPPDVPRRVVVQVEVVKQGQLVVEELRVHGPRAVLLRKLLSDELRTKLIHGVLEKEEVLAPLRRRDVAYPFVGGSQRPVHRGDDRREPSLLDRPARRAKGVVVVGVQAQSPPGLAESARHEVGLQAQDTGAFLERVPDCSPVSHVFSLSVPRRVDHMV